MKNMYEKLKKPADKMAKEASHQRDDAVTEALGGDIITANVLVDRDGVFEFRGERARDVYRLFYEKLEQAERRGQEKIVRGIIDKLTN